MNLTAEEVRGRLAALLPAADRARGKGR
jgi:hypothetical protein